MLEVAVEYRAAIEKMTEAQANGLRKWELDKREWTLATQLRDVLQASRLVTLWYFSRAGKDAPDLTDVIPAMDIIDQKLATGSLNQALDPAIRVALGLGKRSVNHYYNKTDESAVYRIAMVLDPRHKVQYFRDNNWPEEWIAQARFLVRQAYDEDWKGQAVSHEEREGAEEPQVCSQLIIPDLSLLMSSLSWCM
ncbi:uncharacterized protein C8Q71DRAFT_703012 [Rhodofomes roseus]|uniref:Uncharacterized protein n=1 Tax=Rhodofomes roseus TaxID=34475 RepID=A0ABQ8KQ52_9APHY|nr:uncharacterized protein C8Q71DRAFT_703012 [Rhodofomes roseus]KAH9840298.1 hypothetical protein C8Q71DRAFT_703012 [Rhodofomes roseus]